MNTFIAKAKAFLVEEEGLTVVEYAIAGGMISALVIGAFTALGGNVSRIIQGLSDALGKVVTP